MRVEIRGIFEKNINTTSMSWKISGKVMINKSRKFRIEEIWGNSWKIKTSLHSERRRRLCIFEDLLQNPQLCTKYPKTVLFAKRSWKFKSFVKVLRAGQKLARTRCLENGESFNGCQSRVTASDPESFLNLSSKLQPSSSSVLKNFAMFGI